MAPDFRYGCLKRTVRIHLRMKRLEAAENLTGGTPGTRNTTQTRTIEPGRRIFKDQRKRSLRRIESPR